LNIKAQHVIKSDFDIFVKDTLIYFSDLEINQIKIVSIKIILNCFYN